MGQVAVFGVDGNELRSAVERGVMALGHTPRVQIPHLFSRSQAIEARSLLGAFIIGQRAGSGEAAAYYAAEGIPVGCLDYAHLRRPGVAEWRLTAPEVDWVPDFGDAVVPRTRLNRLGVEVSTRRRVKGQVVLLIGQTSGDSVHGMARSEFERWALDALARVRAVTDSKVYWRPHPREAWVLPGADGYSDPDVESLDQALDRSWVVVTYNSTAGLDALVAGLPVVAEGPCVYKDLTGSIASWSSLEPAGGKPLRDLLARLAWGQWSLDEIKSGVPLNLFVPDASTGKLLTYAELASREAAPVEESVAAAVEPEVEPDPVAKPGVEEVVVEPEPLAVEPEELPIEVDPRTVEPEVVESKPRGRRARRAA